MSDSLFNDINYEQKNTKIKYLNLHCVVCDSKLSVGGFFCLNCDPPLPPGDQPEESGISFKQALLRIVIIFTLFIAVIFGRLNISLDNLLTENKTKDSVESLTESKRSQDEDIKMVHSISVSLANIRSKPSKNGEIVLVAKRGIELEIIEESDDWSRIHILGKKGWISNKLIKSEILAPE